MVQIIDEWWGDNMTYKRGSLIWPYDTYESILCIKVDANRVRTYSFIPNSVLEVNQLFTR